MSSVIAYQPTGEPASRETRIFAFGVILIAIGGAFAFFTLSIAYGLALGALLGGRFGVIPPGTNQSRGSVGLLIPILLFSVAAVVFIWTGIGSVRMRRWCRPIVMCLSALAVGGGLLFLLNLALQAYFLPDSTPAPVGRRGGTPAGAIGASTGGATTVFLTTYTLLGIVVPFVFFAAYRDREVERTLDEADARLYWTDRCPMPVLAFAIMMLQFAYVLVLLLPIAMLAPSTPLFGMPLDPAPAAGVFLLAATLFGVAGYFTHRQSPVGPWLGIALVLAAGVSVIMSMYVEPPPPPPGYRRFGTYEAAAVEDGVAGAILSVAVYVIPVIAFALWVLRLQQTTDYEMQPAASPLAPLDASNVAPPVRVERPLLTERVRGGRPFR